MTGLSSSIRWFSKMGRSLLLDCGGPQVSLTVLSPHILRVRLAPHGTFAARRSWAVPVPDEDFPETPFEVQETETSLIVQTAPSGPQGKAGVTVHIQRDPCRLAFADPSGQVFCADTNEAGMQWQDQDMDDQAGADAPDWRVACDKRIEPGEHFFGAGQRTGLLDKRGKRLVNWTTDAGTGQGPGTDPLYLAIPVVLALRPGLAYGVFFNNTWASAFDLGRGHPEVWRMEAEGGELDYYVCYGPTPLEVSEGLGRVLGTMPLPPRWSLGYHQSRWSYAPEAHVRSVAAGFRSRDIPCDVLHLDIGYMDGYRVFTWDPLAFPDPPTLLADLRQEGFRTVTIIDPGVKADPNYHVYREGLEQDFFIRRSSGGVFHGYVWPDDSVFSDYTRPEVREWWGDLQRTLVEQGSCGIWNDMNEPPVFYQPFSQNVRKRTWGTIDLDARQGPAGEETTHAEVHNLFGQGMVRASYEGLRRHLGDERPFVLTRSGFAGVQHWSACWMGDNNSWWEHLEMSMPQLMNMGLSGVPFVGVDIGGFAGNADGELFARWMQLGALYPFCRGHTTHFSADHEPWAFGPQVEAICRTYLQLRYRLLPYLSTLFWEASTRGTPVLRPLLYEFPSDPATYQLHDQVMLGPFVLAAPVYQPGRDYRAVYLPAGDWYDWWTNEVLSGPVHVLAHAPLERMPLYVRAGAILPMGPDLRFTAEKPLDPLTLHLYPGEGTFTLYEDDGHTFAYERGEHCTTRYRLYRDLGADQTTSVLKFDIGERVGNYHPPDRRLILAVHGVEARAAEDYPDAHYDPQKRTLTLVLDPGGDSEHGGNGGNGGKNRNNGYGWGLGFRI
jgi:alpha-glucosidase